MSHFYDRQTSSCIFWVCFQVQEANGRWQRKKRKYQIQFKRPIKLAQEPFKGSCIELKIPRIHIANGIWCFQFTLSSSRTVALYAKIRLFIHANLFNPRSWSLLWGWWQQNPTESYSLSINYEHKRLRTDLISWKRIKRTHSGQTSPAVCCPKIARLLCFFCLVNELLENGKEELRQQQMIRWCSSEFVYFIFIIFQFFAFLLAFGRQ